MTVDTVPVLWGELDTYVEPFLKHLRSVGYAKRTLCGKRTTAESFARWTRRQHVAVEDLNESHLAAFVKRSGQRLKAGAAHELAVLRPFLDYVRAEAGVAAAPSRIAPSVAGQIEQRYRDYLRTERGLTERSVCVYLPLIHDFLTELEAKAGGASTQRLDALIVKDFLLDRVGDRSSEYCRLLATAMRSLLRFLHLRGETMIDLSLCVPTVRRYRGAAVHPYLSPDEVERVLSATDRSSARGRRDHAILLLLARLGLRAGEIVTLDLGDIRWRAGEIVVRGKGRVLDRLPLLADVGEALALYLRKDRGASASRRVFLRMLAPRVGLGGPAAVGHIVRKALARAALRPSSRVATHLFRHSLATRMIREGASITEISEVLRHRAQSTTQIYAKVAFEDLRRVARPWPGTGGAL